MSQDERPPLPDHVVMRPVVSGNIARSGYDPVARHLYVDFGTPEKPSVYRYDDFPIEKHNAFNIAPSKGSHFHANIRGQHKTTKINAPAWTPPPPMAAA